jgi:hypothetical protein
MPKLTEMKGLAEFVTELKDGGMPWESKEGANIRDAVIADERFTGAIKERGSIIPLRDLYRKHKLATDGSVKSSGVTVEPIRTKGRNWRDHVWAARRAGMGLTLLSTATGLAMPELKKVLAEAPDGAEMLKRSYGLNEDGTPKWSEGAAKIHAARIAAEANEDEDDEEDDEPTEPAAKKPRRRPNRPAKPADEQSA